jgi:leucine-zipper of insertion element IS481
MVHANAKLTPRGRLELARCVVEDRWPLRRAAERFQVSATTAKRWADRYRLLGPAGMGDRSSRPHHSPSRTARRIEQRIVKLRITHRLDRPGSPAVSAWLPAPCTASWSATAARG